MVTRLLWLFTVAVAGLVTLSCASPVAYFVMNAPASAVSGVPFSVTVTAMAEGRRDTIYNTPVHFTSSDSAATLPIDYAFTAADAGSHTFTGIILVTSGNQSLTVTDVIAASITARANITVTTMQAENRAATRAVLPKFLPVPRYCPRTKRNLEPGPASR